MKELYVPPKELYLDPHKVLFDRLSYDPRACLRLCTAVFQQYEFGKAMIKAAHLLEQNGKDPLEPEMYRAFTQAGAVACAAFVAIDLPEELCDSTLSSFKEEDVPDALPPGGHGEALVAFRTLANKGHASHPEFSEHTDLMERFYSGMTENRKVGERVLIGAGYALYWLGQTWERVRQPVIDEIFTVETQNLDWSALLSKED